MGSGSVRYSIALLVLLCIGVATYWATEGPQAPAASAIDGPPVVESDISTAGVRIPPVEVYEPPVEQTDPAPDPVVNAPELDADSGQVLVPPTFRDYMVERNDNAERISRKVYGDRVYWRAIMQANPNVDFDRGLRVGQMIRVPVDPSNVQGRVVDADDVAATTETDPASTGETEWVVQRGDTLSGIAKAVYGRASMWRLIRDANSDQINRDGTNIRVGMTLRIPPPPVGESR
ncbi:MAG: LysM peptidoglycan-binding domain-containing protein [Planctomycetota bacterium]